MEERLVEAIRLREAGRHEEARDILVALVSAGPDNPIVNYQTAWIHDVLGLEREAVPFYERAIAGALTTEERRGALLGLGSTYHALGQFRQSERALACGIAEFPEDRSFEVFLAMTLYTQGRYAEAMEIALRTLAETSEDRQIQQYRSAICFYAGKLSRVSSWKK